MKKNQECIEKRQDSSHQRNRLYSIFRKIKSISRKTQPDQEPRRAAFVHEEENSGAFKYSPCYRINNRFRKMFANRKRYLNSIKQKPRLWAGRVNWEPVKMDLRNWVVNIFLEGIVVNFAVWALFKADFNLATIFAYGIFIDRLVDIYWRLRQHGSSSKIPNKNK